MKIGVSSYTWAWGVGIKGFEPVQPLGVQDLVEKAKQSRVGVLQIADNPSLHDMDENALDELVKKADARGIELEAGTRGIEPEHLLRYLRIAKRIKSKIVRTITHRLDKEAAAWMKEVLSEYRKEGISIALENHDEHQTAELADFIERLGNPHLGVCLDTVNSFAALEPPDVVVKTLGPHTLNLHVKDFDVVRVQSQLGFSIQGRPAGKGRLDIPGIVSLLREMGRDPNAILELWTPFEGNIEKTVEKEELWAAESLSYLRTVLPSA
jgi:sugar phosphate isomerase/epimerase